MEDEIPAEYHGTEEEGMARLWAKIIEKHRISRQATAECAPQEVEEALTELCHEFDIPCPIWLHKHEREFADFRHTAFLPEHFMEDVPFHKLEIEYLEDDGKTRRSNDPRNYFDGI